MIAAIALALLGLASHAAALGLIDVKPFAVYQHYRPWEWIVSERPLAAWVLLLQTVVVVALAWRLRDRLRATFGGLVSFRAMLLPIALAGAALAIPTESIGRFAGEVVLSGALVLVSVLNFLLAVLVIPESLASRAWTWIDARLTFGEETSTRRRWDRVIPVAVALWVTLVSAIASDVVFERVPHLDDSVSNLFHAKYFAAGKLYLPAPPDTPSFQVDQTVVDSGKWFGYAFPVWPAVLALGVRIGAPWLVNAALGGLLIVLAHALIRRRAGVGCANIAVVTLAASPWLIFMSAELMPHPLTGVLVVGAALACQRVIERPRSLAWAALCGTGIGLLMLTRAIDGAIVAVALGLTILFERRVTYLWRAAAVAGLAALLIAVLIFPYNRAVTGRASYPPHMAWSDGHWGPGVDRLGFGNDIGIRQWANLDPFPGHGLADVVLNANKNLFMTNIDLFGWASGSLLFVWLAIGLARWRRDDTLWIAIVASFVVGYSFYWFSGGPDIGARYWYPVLVPVSVLSARGAQMAITALSGRLEHVTLRVVAFTGLAILSSILVMLPWRASTKYYRYRGITGEVRTLAAANRFDHALVFIRADNQRDYASAFVMNPWTLDDPATIYAFDAGRERRAAVISHFSDRPVWVIGRVGSTPAGQGPFEVLVGPLPPGTVPP